MKPLCLIINVFYSSGANFKTATSGDIIEVIADRF